MTINECLIWAVDLFKQSQLEQPRFEAEVLMDAIIGQGRAFLYAHSADILDETHKNMFKDGVKRRAAREPMAYIIGHREFMGMDLTVNPDVLIPRPDTECVVEAAMGVIPKDQKISVLDLCTGSGAIGLAIKQFFPKAEVTLSDVSAAALAVATNNAQRLGLKVNVVQGDLFSAVKAQQFDLIISNPPYIPSHVIEGLEPDVAQYEPILALDGGNSGFDLYNRIIMEAPGYLKNGGHLVLEAGDGQADGLIRQMTDVGLNVDIRQNDLIGIIRGVGASKNAQSV